MIQIPLRLISSKPIVTVPEQDQSKVNCLIQGVTSKRSQVQSITQQSNLISTISILEEYLNEIYRLCMQTFPEVNYLQVASKVQTLRLCLGVPWKLPFSFGESTDTKTPIQWSLKDEIFIVVSNLSICYSLRANQSIDSILDSTADYKEDNQWLSIFKNFKKSLMFTNFLLNQNQNEENILTSSIVWEVSPEFAMLLDTTVRISIQITFLIKSLLILSNFHYDIDDVLMKDSNINYSTMTRIATFVKNKLVDLKTIMNRVTTLKQSKEYELLMNYNNINEIFIGIFLGIEFYKKDDLGNAIGSLNYSIELITSKNINEEDQLPDSDEDSKIKLKLSKFKSKLKFKASKSNKPIKKLKINKSLLDSSSSSNPSQFIKILNIQYQIIENLHYKFHLQNNSMNFQTVLPSKDVLSRWMPMGRSVPITENSYWKPDNAGSITSPTQQSEAKQYY